MRSSRNNEIRIDGDIFNKTLMKAFKYLDKKGIDKAQEDMILKKVNPSSIIDELSRKAVDDAGSQLADLSFDIGVSSV